MGGILHEWYAANGNIPVVGDLTEDGCLEFWEVIEPPADIFTQVYEFLRGRRLLWRRCQWTRNRELEALCVFVLFEPCQEAASR
jgi:hypothetical protein